MSMTQNQPGLLSRALLTISGYCVCPSMVFAFRPVSIKTRSLAQKIKSRHSALVPAHAASMRAEWVAGMEIAGAPVISLP